MNTKEFRIKEYRGNFKIQRKVVKQIGMWWWKKTETKWYDIDIYGKPMCYSLAVPIIKQINPTYTSLKAAKLAIKDIVKGVSYHTC